jgi:uncharacterized phage protein (TIGR01671 family)
MKRVIKFRAWCPYLNEMAEPGSFEMDVALANSEQYELMQFTGLLDKNGTEIYEGDICQVDYYDLGIINGQVVFRIIFSGYYLEGNNFQASMFTWEPKFIEVIGNVFENPELLQP